MDDSTLVEIYTDGACSGNPGPGGWGAILRLGEHEKEVSGGAMDTTNNRMELQAAIEALAALKRPCRVKLFTDSNYVVKGMTEWMPGWVAKGWKSASGKPVMNRDLWETLLEQAGSHHVDWHWIRGHAGHKDNERADALARAAIPSRY